MGKIIRVKCEGCGLEKDVYTGGSIRDCEIEMIMKLLTPERQEILSAAVKNGASGISVTREPCICVSCGEIYAYSAVFYRMNNIDKRLRGVCPHCGSENCISAKKCPQCKGVLSHSIAGHWD